MTEHSKILAAYEMKANSNYIVFVAFPLLPLYP